MVLLYKSLVRPILEYGHAVWFSYLRRNIDLIKDVQKSFPKNNFGVEGMGYKKTLFFFF